MLYKLPIFFFYPLVLLWSIVYGATAGCIYKVVAVYENWLAINHMQIRLWKKYPRRSYRKYIENLWTQQIKGKSIEFAEYTRVQLEKDHPEEPFPLFRLLTNTVFMILILPFMALSGLFHGPLYVYKTALIRYRKQSGRMNGRYH